MKKIGLYWMGNDLRVHDNPIFDHAVKHVTELLCVYCVEPSWQKPNRYHAMTMGRKRQQFLAASLTDLHNALQRYGQHLHVSEMSALDEIPILITQFNINCIYRSRHAGYYEQQQWLKLQQRYPSIEFIEIDTHTLYDQAALPFTLDNLPSSFTQFRKKIENHQLPPQAINEPNFLPPCPTSIRSRRSLLNSERYRFAQESEPLFEGGEQAGLYHLHEYFFKRLPSHYKTVRNALDGWENSTKLSPWLAFGCLSPRYVLSLLRFYEDKVDANESTYWIYFELLWREYFQWYAHRYGSRLFNFAGIKERSPTTCYYPERYQKWCNGSTPFPLVNACMRQLNATGFMSNRGRQIVASCFVHELGLDWRYGAAYFQQQLVDYDVAVNWGNWQYIAGVGADPRGHRHFDLEKQTKRFDPEWEFISKWQSLAALTPLDSVDAADWPIT